MDPTRARIDLGMRILTALLELREPAESDVAAIRALADSPSEASMDLDDLTSAVVLREIREVVRRAQSLACHASRNSPSRMPFVPPRHRQKGI
jgi:hypothetical protein